MTGVAWAGYTGLALLIVGWLVVSFSRPGGRRVVAEWVSACGLYLALFSLFVSLSLRAQAAGSTPALVAFGFLVALFGSGLVVSTVQMLLSLRLRGPGRMPSSANATH